MENNPQMQALLEKIEATNRQQLLFTKILCVLCALAVICSLVVMVTVTKTATQISELAAPIQDLTAQSQTVLHDLSVTLKDLSAKAGTVLNDLETAASELSKVDFGSMVSQVDTLTKDSQAAVEEALSKLDAIDIDTLNKAIKDLAAVVDPLAKVGKIFG